MCEKLLRCEFSHCNIDIFPTQNCSATRVLAQALRVEARNKGTVVENRYVKWGWSPCEDLVRISSTTVCYCRHNNWSSKPDP